MKHASIAEDLRQMDMPITLFLYQGAALTTWRTWRGLAVRAIRQKVT